MATWKQCSTYNEDRDPVWVNLDQVIAIRDCKTYSVIVGAVTDVSGAIEIAVWDKASDLVGS
jgi:hypothetical protein